MTQTTLRFTDHQLADLLCSALEGGSDYWIHEMKVHDGKHDGHPWGKEYTPGYIRAPFSTGGSVELDPGEGDPVVRLNRAALDRGLQVLADKFLHHFADILADNADAETGDAFLQCCVFGDIIYG